MSGNSTKIIRYTKKLENMTHNWGGWCLGREQSTEIVPEMTYDRNILTRALSSLIFHLLKTIEESMSMTLETAKKTSDPY